jgi:hypothetical protein
MAEDNTVARSLHDLGLAAWFGGSLMGAVGLNGAAAEDEAVVRLKVPGGIEAVCFCREVNESSLWE